MRTIFEQLEALRGTDDVKDLAEHIKSTMDAMDPEDIAQMSGASFALASLIIDAAGFDVRKATAAFFIGLCDNDTTEALGFMLQAKREADARAAAEVKP